MGGNPLLRIAAVIVLLAITGMSVWMITKNDATSISKAAKEKPQPRTVELEISVIASEAWQSCTIRNASETLIDAKAGQQQAHKTITVDIKKFPMDIVVSAAWTTGSNHAVRIETRQADAAIQSMTLWGNESVEDVVTIPAPGKP